MDPNQRQVNPDISGHNPTPESTESPVVVSSDVPKSNDVPTLPTSMTTQKPKHRLPLIPIVIAVVVALTLISTTIFVFVQSKNKKPVVNNTQTDDQQKPDDGRVSPDDIDTAIKDIEKSLNNINDSTDFQTDDLSNQTLGL